MNEADDLLDALGTTAENRGMTRFQARGGNRLHWRVSVQSSAKLDGSRGAPKMIWHLVECVDPVLDSAHCLQGRLLLAAGGDPDGHCLVDEVCPRCAMSSGPLLYPEAPLAVEKTSPW